jgi:sarcosine oxidase subunit delta
MPPAARRISSVSRKGAACPYCGIAACETNSRRISVPGPTRISKPSFLRPNVKGVHFERWRHAMGCGKWFLAARDTATLEVFGTYPAQTTEPPADIIAAIKAKRPDWEGSGMSTRLAGAAA